MHLSEFNYMYLKNHLENLSHEKKTIVLMGDFDTDFLKNDNGKDSAGFLDSIMLVSFYLTSVHFPEQHRTLKPLLIISFLIISKTAVYQRIL